MPESAIQSGHYRSRFDALEKRLADDKCAWLRPLRHAAMDRFEELGFPTIKNEEWRYTNVRPIASTIFETAHHAQKFRRKRLRPSRSPAPRR